MKKNFQGYLGIIARMGSKRLPDKHAININQVPIIKYLINRMKTYFDKDIEQEKIKIVILTGSKNKNRLLGEIANQCEIEVYYGDDDNIPIRMFNFLKYKKSDFIISIDGDDVLCSPEGSLAILKELNKNRQYVKTKGLPFGMNSMGMTTSFLQESISKNDRNKLETGWGWIFDEKSCYYIDFKFNNDNRLRFTLDYKEDLNFFKKLILSQINIISANTNDIIDLVIKEKYYLENEKINSLYWDNFKKQQSLEIGE